MMGMDGQSGRGPLTSNSAALFTATGVAAAFGLASCCALPTLLATLGIGTLWLGGIAGVAVEHRALLLWTGSLCLLAGAVLLWRQQRGAVACANSAYPSRWTRVITLIGLIAGGLLLWARHAYA